jgi:hypothetical protein
MPVQMTSSKYTGKLKTIQMPESSSDLSLTIKF